jgi:hypothetical protein
MTATETEPSAVVAPLVYDVYSTQVPAERAQAILDEWVQRNDGGSRSVDSVLSEVGLGGRQALGETIEGRHAWQEAGMRTSPWMDRLRDHVEGRGIVAEAPAEPATPLPYATVDELRASIRGHLIAGQAEHAWCDGDTDAWLRRLQCGPLSGTPTAVREAFAVFEQQVSSYRPDNVMVAAVRQGFPNVPVASATPPDASPELLTSQLRAARLTAMQQQGRVRDRLVEAYRSGELTLDEVNSILGDLDLELYSQTWTGSVTLNVTVRNADDEDDARRFIERGFDSRDSDVEVDDHYVDSLEQSEE